MSWLICQTGPSTMFMSVRNHPGLPCAPGMKSTYLPTTPAPSPLPLLSAAPCSLGFWNVPGPACLGACVQAIPSAWNEWLGPSHFGDLLGKGFTVPLLSVSSFFSLPAPLVSLIMLHSLYLVYLFICLSACVHVRVCFLSLSEIVASQRQGWCQVVSRGTARCQSPADPGFSYLALACLLPGVIGLG